jgi:hypothetical protein
VFAFAALRSCALAILRRLPSEKQRLLAQLGAARICLNQLNRPMDALRFYEAMSTSVVPHLDLERDIESGIRQAKITIAQNEEGSARVVSASSE